MISLKKLFHSGKLPDPSEKRSKFAFTREHSSKQLKRSSKFPKTLTLGSEKSGFGGSKIEFEQIQQVKDLKCTKSLKVFQIHLGVILFWPKLKKSCLKNLKRLQKGLTSLELFVYVLPPIFSANHIKLYQEALTFIRKIPHSVQIKLYLTIFEPSTEFREFLQKVSSISNIHLLSLDLCGDDLYFPKRELLLLLSNLKSSLMEEFHLEFSQPDRRLNESVYTNLPEIKEALMKFKRLKKLKFHMKIEYCRGVFKTWRLYHWRRLWFLMREFAENLPVAEMILNLEPFKGLAGKDETFSYSSKLKNKGSFKTVIGKEMFREMTLILGIFAYLMTILKEYIF